jgi:hypothetical protein
MKESEIVKLARKAACGDCLFVPGLCVSQCVKYRFALRGVRAGLKAGRKEK